MMVEASCPTVPPLRRCSQWQPLRPPVLVMEPGQTLEEPLQDTETLQEMSDFRKEMKLALHDIRKVLEDIRQNTSNQLECFQRNDCSLIQRMLVPPSPSNSLRSHGPVGKKNRGSTDSVFPDDLVKGYYRSSACSSLGRCSQPSMGVLSNIGRKRNAPSLVMSAKRTSTISAPAEESTGGLFGKMGPDTTKLDEQEYDVSMYYRESGCSQYVARHEAFANITLGIIILNTVYIGIDADRNPANDPTANEASTWPFLVCDNLFCIFFTFELAVRFFAFTRKRDCLKDFWFNFDAALVASMIWETWIIQLLLGLNMFATNRSVGPAGMFKMLRLLRVARMARLMRAVPELVAMVKGVKVAARAVSSALVMLVLLVYVFAIVLFLQLRESGMTQFHTLGYTMWTLLCDGVFLQTLGSLSFNLLHASKHLEVVILTLFVLASNLTVLNMLVGVLCEVVSSVAACEKETAAVRLMKRTLLVLLRTFDEDGNGSISQEEIEKVLDNPDAVAVLRSLEVDTGSLLEELGMYYEAKTDLTIQEIMELILLLRGDRKVTVKDMIHGQGVTRYKLAEVMEEMTTIHGKLDRLCDTLVSQTFSGSDPAMQKIPTYTFLST